MTASKAGTSTPSDKQRALESMRTIVIACVVFAWVGISGRFLLATVIFWRALGRSLCRLHAQLHTLIDRYR